IHFSLRLTVPATVFLPRFQLGRLYQQKMPLDRALNFVPEGRLELPPLAGRDFESRAATITPLRQGPFFGLAMLEYPQCRNFSITQFFGSRSIKSIPTPSSRAKNLTKASSMTLRAPSVSAA